MEKVWVKEKPHLMAGDLLITAVYNNKGEYYTYKLFEVEAHASGGLFLCDTDETIYTNSDNIKADLYFHLHKPK